MGVAAQPASTKARSATGPGKSSHIPRAEHNQLLSAGHAGADMHRGLGNQALMSLLQRGGLQTKLSVSHPGDAFEREADRVADRVTQMPASAVSNDSPKPGVAANTVQRKCTACEKEEQQQKISSLGSVSVQRACATCDKEKQPVTIQAKRDSGPESISRNSANIFQGSGQPLTKAEQSYFSPRFGRDFNHVRVHNNRESYAMARELNARAFTVGSDIGFAEGQYQSSSYSGRKLMAHELTHTIQQSQHGMQIQRNAAGRCNEGNQLTSNRAGEIAHEQIEDYYIHHHGFKGEVPIPRGTKDNRTPQCAARTRPKGKVDLWKEISTNHFQIAEIKAITRSDPAGDAQGEAIHYQRRARHSVGRLSGSSPCGTRFPPTTNQDTDIESINRDTYFNDNHLNGTGSASNPANRADFSLLNRDVTTAVPGQQVGEYYKGDRNKILKARRLADGAVTYWCNPKEESGDENTYICGLQDSGVLSDLLDKAVQQGEQLIDEFIDNKADALISQVIDNLTLQEALTHTYQYIRPAIRDLVIEHWGQTTWALIESMGDEQAVSYIAGLIDRAVEEGSEETLRNIARRLKREIINTIKQRLKQALRAYFQAAISALCQENFAVSIAALLQQLTGELPQMFTQVFLDIVAEAAVLSAAAIAVTIALMILLIIAIIVIVVVVVFAWPALVGGGAVAGTAGGGTVVAGGVTAGTATTGAVTGTTATGVTLTVVQGGAAAGGSAAAAETITAIAASVLLALGIGQATADDQSSGGGT